jgi:hypothetical protein
MELRTALRCGLVAVSLASLTLKAADHVESPGPTRDNAADIADVFIFPSPESTAKLVMAMTFGGGPAPRVRVDGRFYCDPDILYTFNIDRADAGGAFDSVPDVRIYARLGRNANNQCGLQLENVPGAAGIFSGPIEQVITTSNGLKAFAGLRNDPFFFDAQGLTALFATFAAPGQNGDLISAFGIGTRARRDSFAGRNASAIVFEMSLDAVAPMTANGSRPQLRAWATTARLVR